jgi:hypothetical protein
LPTTDDSGFAVTYVPASDRGPHMAKCGEDRYYRRSGDRFVRMEHFEIADMFGRRPQPKLSFYYRIDNGASGGGPEGSHRDVNVFLGLRNDGRGSAKAPYFAVLISRPYSVDRHGIDGNFNFGLPELPISAGSEWSRFGGGDGRYIYPGTELDVALVSLSVYEHVQALEPVRLKYEYAADGVPLEAGKARILGSELRAAAWPAEDGDDA